MAQEIENSAAFRAVHPGGGEPAEPNGEEKLQHQPEPEDGHRQAEVADERGDVVQEAVRPARGEDAEDERTDERDDQARRHEQNGVREDLPDHRRDRPELAVGEAEVAAHDVEQPGDELLMHWAIEPHAVPDVGELLRRHPPILGKERVRSAWGELHEDKREHRDPQQEGNRFQNAAHDEADHGASPGDGRGRRRR